METFDAIHSERECVTRLAQWQGDNEQRHSNDAADIFVSSRQPWPEGGL